MWRCSLAFRAREKPRFRPIQNGLWWEMMSMVGRPMGSSTWKAGATPNASGFRKKVSGDLERHPLWQRARKCGVAAQPAA